jgi:GNAT superfamily N-acetyltransferase
MPDKPEVRDELSLRRAREGDADLLARIHVDAWKAAYRGLVPDEHLHGLDPEHRADGWRRFLGEGLAETYVATLDGAAVGFITFAGCRDEDVDTRSTGEIWGIYLHPKAWRKGIGRRLCRFAEQALEKRGFGVIVLWVFEGNAPARCFYETMGYCVDGAMKTIEAGAPLWAVRYRKTIRRSRPSPIQAESSSESGRSADSRG